MEKSRPPNSPEYLRPVVGLVRSGNSPSSLARESEPSIGPIRNWVHQADADEGHRKGDLSTAEVKKRIQPIDPRTELVLEALEITRSQRRPEGAISHSDRGSSDQGSHYT